MSHLLESFVLNQKEAEMNVPSTDMCLCMIAFSQLYNRKSVI